MRFLIDRISEWLIMLATLTKKNQPVIHVNKSRSRSSIQYWRWNESTCNIKHMDRHECEVKVSPTKKHSVLFWSRVCIHVITNIHVTELNIRTLQDISVFDMGLFSFIFHYVIYYSKYHLLLPALLLNGTLVIVCTLQRCVHIYFFWYFFLVF